MSEDQVKIVDFKDIGSVSFIRKPSVRNLKITIKPFKGILVTVPGSVSLESAGRFVEEKKSWIKNSQLKLNRYEKRVTIFEEGTGFNTRDYVLQLERHEKASIKTIIGSGKILINFPHFADIHDPRVQKQIKKAIVQAWRIEASKYLPERIKELSQKHNLKYDRLTVRDNKTRWGSCSRNNNISLNIHLMRLPHHLADYIILHELAHIVHKHHQKPFWHFLDVLTGGRAKILDRELSKYSPEVW